MKTFEVAGKHGNFILNLPTSIKEITPEFFSNCAKEIDIADHYALIALAYTQPVAMIINAFKKREATIGVIPIFIKANKTNDSFISSLNMGDKLVITGSAISLGIHVNLPGNDLSIENFMYAVDGADSFRVSALKDTTPCVFIDFKLIPFVDISGAYVDGVKTKQTHIVKAPTILNSPSVN